MECGDYELRAALGSGVLGANEGDDEGEADGDPDHQAHEERHRSS